MGAAAGAMFALAAGTANADLIINVNGSDVATDPTNTFTSYASAVGDWNIVSTTFAGNVALGSGNELADVGVLAISTNGLGTPLTLKFTETNLNQGVPGSVLFDSNFSSSALTNLTVTRSFYLDPLNGGAETYLLGQTTGSNLDVFSLPYTLTGPYSIVEEIDLSVVTRGSPANISSDDKLIKVPEPPTLAVIGAALLGLGFLRRRKKQVA